MSNSSTIVRLNPPPEIASLLRKWFGSVRYTYNWALSCIKKKPNVYKINHYWLRKKFINKNHIHKKNSWLLDTPKSVRDGALKDLTDAFKINFDKKRKDPSHNFDIKFRSRKDIQSIYIPSIDIRTWDKEKGEMSMFPTFLKNKILFYAKKSKNAPKAVLHDCRLTMNKLGHFHLCIPIAKEACENQTSKEDNWCSIDPGVRTGWTVYSPTQGECYKIGDKDIGRIFRLCIHLDGLISRTENMKTNITIKTKKMKKRMRRKRRRMLKAQIRLRQRIKHLMDDVHWKTINFLTSRYSNIIIPPFNVSSMIGKKDRRITKETVRKMVCWKHFTFRQRLLYKASLVNVNVFVRGESYTSKTCTSCFNVHHALGANKQFKCPSCHLIADRDVCGARNIFLKNALGT